MTTTIYGGKLGMSTNPDHYKSDAGIEVIDIIVAFKLNFSLGNAIKYILRHARKGNPKLDLRKARWYITAALEQLGEPAPLTMAHNWIIEKRGTITEEIETLDKGELPLYIQGLMMEAYKRAITDLGLRFHETDT